MRLLITGGGGQLATDLVRACGDDEVVAPDRASLDITDERAVATLVDEVRPDVVVNTAAFTAVDACETEPDHAHAVNALGPWWLARACRRVGARLVHLSTDYVFDGTAPLDAAGRPRGLVEHDPIAPLNAYGRSKAAGEALVRETHADHVIVRTAWLAGAGGGNFVRTMLRLAGERDQVAVVDDQIGSPTFCADLAPALRHLAASDLTGTFHLVNEGTASWFELATATFALAGLDVEVTPQPSSALDRPAPRPGWSVLDTRHARLSGVPPLPHWRDGLAHLLAELADGGRGA